MSIHNQIGMEFHLITQHRTKAYKNTHSTPQNHWNIIFQPHLLASTKWKLPLGASLQASAHPEGGGRFPENTQHSLGQKSQRRRVYSITFSKLILILLTYFFQNLHHSNLKIFFLNMNLKVFRWTVEPVAGKSEES